MVGQVVFVDHLAAVGAVSAFFMLDKRDFQRGGCTVAIGVFVVDGAKVVGAFGDGKDWGICSASGINCLSEFGARCAIIIADLPSVCIGDFGWFVKMVVSYGLNSLVFIRIEIPIAVIAVIISHIGSIPKLGDPSSLGNGRIIRHSSELVASVQIAEIVDLTKGRSSIQAMPVTGS